MKFYNKIFIIFILASKINIYCAETEEKQTNKQLNSIEFQTKASDILNKIFQKLKDLENKKNISLNDLDKIHNELLQLEEQCQNSQIFKEKYLKLCKCYAIQWFLKYRNNLTNQADKINDTAEIRN